MDQRFILTLTLTSPYHDTVYNFATKVEPDVVSDMERAVGAMNLSRDLGVGVMGFDDVVRMMRQRQFRRDQLIELARLLGMQMADFMEDKEGWHGPDRAESARDYLEVRHRTA